MDKQLNVNGLAHSYSKNFSTSQTLANILSEHKFTPESSLSTQKFTYQSERISPLDFWLNQNSTQFLDVSAPHSIQEDSKYC